MNQKLNCGDGMVFYVDKNSSYSRVKVNEQYASYTIERLEISVDGLFDVEESIVITEYKYDLTTLITHLKTLTSQWRVN